MTPHDALLSLITVALIIIIPNILFRLLNQQLTYNQYHTCRIPLSPCSYYKTEMYQTNLVCLKYVIISVGCLQLLDAALADPIQSKFLVVPMIDQLRGSGGVRIEDDILVTETGHEMLTKVPRT